MARKTYSKQGGGKRSAPYDPNWVQDDDGSRKRSKTEDADELHLPSAREKASSLVKKSLKNFGGPISVPRDDVDIGPAPVSSKKNSVFDRVLDQERYLPPKPKQNGNSISREAHAERWRVQQRLKQHPVQPRSHQLPTPPAEAEKQLRRTHQERPRQHMLMTSRNSDSELVLKTVCIAKAPDQTSRIFRKATSDEQSREPYRPKAFKAEHTLVPHRDVLENRISRRSNIAKL